MQNKIQNSIILFLVLCIGVLSSFCWTFYNNQNISNRIVQESLNETKNNINLISSGMDLNEKRLRAILQTEKIVTDYNEKYKNGLKQELIHSIATWIVDYSSKYPNIDHMLLLSLFIHESRLNPMAKSPVEAKGLGQLMNGTARQICYRFGWTFTDSIAFNPEKNILMSSYWLSNLIDINNDNVELALAEYNGSDKQRTRYKFFKQKENGILLDSLQEIEVGKLAMETQKYPESILSKEKELRNKYSLMFTKEIE